MDYLDIVWSAPNAAGESAQVDFVFVHGLNPKGSTEHGYATWTHKDDTCWPRDLLPKTIPRSRVMIAGYNASVLFDTSNGSVRTHAAQLLDRIKGARQQMAEINRPLIFVCHSLGGIVVKQALVHAALRDHYYGSIRKSTIGIMFFGTPHGGGNKATTAGFLANIASIFSGQPRNSLLATLRRNSLYNEATTDDFNAQIGDFTGRIVSFMETKKVEIKIKERKFLPQLMSMLVVDRTASKLGSPGEICLETNSDHRNMCKFSNSKDKVAQFQPVISNLQHMTMNLRTPENVEGPLSVPLRLRDDTRHFFAPDSNPHLVGRDDIIYKLNRQFETSGLRRAALFGIGGVGKTQCAIQFCHAVKIDTHVLWVNAESSSTMNESFKGIAEALSLGISGETKQWRLPVLNWLSSAGKSLLVFDNVVSLSFLREFIPQQGGRNNNINVLLTTRESSIIGSQLIPFGLEVTLLDFDDATRLFVLSLSTWTDWQKMMIRSRSLNPTLDWEVVSSSDISDASSTNNDSDESVQMILESKFDLRNLHHLTEIVLLTGLLPLAIVQCGSYLRQYPMPYSAYVKRFKAKSPIARQKFLSHNSQGSTYDESVMTTWEVSFDRIIQDLPCAGDLLTMLGFLGRSSTSMDLLESAVLDLMVWQGKVIIQLPSDLREKFCFLGPESDLFETLGLLKSLSLVSANQGRRILSIHPMIHEWTHLRLPMRESFEWVISVIRLLYHRLPPLIYSSKDAADISLQAEAIFCHLPRCKELLELYFDDIQDYPAEVALFFLEAYLWYRGSEYLSIAERVAERVEISNRAWTKRLVFCGMVHDIVQVYQGSRDDLDTPLYQHYSNQLDELHRDDCTTPSGSRFILTEAALAHQLLQLLDKGMKVDMRTNSKHVEKDAPRITGLRTLAAYPQPTSLRSKYEEHQSTTWIYKATRDVLNRVPNFSAAPKLPQENVTALDLVASAIFAQYGSREDLLNNNMTLQKAYQQLFQCRRGAYLGIEYGIPEMAGYFKELFNRIYKLPPAESVNAWADTVFTLLTEDADEILMATVDSTSKTSGRHITVLSHLDKGIHSFDHGFLAANNHPRMSDIVSALCGKLKFTDIVLQHVIFPDPLVEKDWFQMHLAVCRQVLGFAHPDSLKCAIRISDLVMEKADQSARDTAISLLQEGLNASQESLDLADQWAHALYNALKRGKPPRIEVILRLCRQMIGSHQLILDEARGNYLLGKWEDRVRNVYKESDEHDKLIAFGEEVLVSRKSIRVKSPYLYTEWADKLFTDLDAPEDATRRLGLCKEQLAWEPYPPVSTSTSRPTMHYVSWSAKLIEVLKKSKAVGELQAHYREVMASHKVFENAACLQYHQAAKELRSLIIDLDSKQSLYQLSEEVLMHLFNAVDRHEFKINDNTIIRSAMYWVQQYQISAETENRKDDTWGKGLSKRLLDAALKLYKAAPSTVNFILPEITEIYLKDPGVPQLEKAGLSMKLVNAALDLYKSTPNADVAFRGLTASLTLLDSPGVPQVAKAGLSTRMLDAILDLNQVAPSAARPTLLRLITRYLNDPEVSQMDKMSKFQDRILRCCYGSSSSESQELIDKPFYSSPPLMQQLESREPGPDANLQSSQPVIDHDLLKPFGDPKTWVEQQIKMFHAPLPSEKLQSLRERGFDVPSSIPSDPKYSLLRSDRGTDISLVSLPIGMLLNQDHDIIFSAYIGRLGFEGALWVVRERISVEEQKSSSERWTLLWTRYVGNVIAYVDVSTHLSFKSCSRKIDGNLYTVVTLVSSATSETFEFFFSQRNDVLALRSVLAKSLVLIWNA